MQKLFGGFVVTAVALSLPVAAIAQRHASAPSSSGPKREFGVDLNAAYVSPGTDGVSSGIAIITPVDLRYGFVPRSGKIMWEPRVSLNFNTVGGDTRYVLTPGVNLLYSNSPGGHHRGMYFTGGAGLVLGDPSGNASGTAVKLEGGVGWRKPYGAGGAFRYELGFQWVGKSDNLAAFGLADYLAFGGRVGISLWH
jgi:hypothetical protein